MQKYDRKTEKSELKMQFVYQKAKGLLGSYGWSSYWRHWKSTFYCRSFCFGAYLVGLALESRLMETISWKYW